MGWHGGNFEHLDLGSSAGAINAQLLFSDPKVRSVVRTWFCEGVALLEMVERLGILHNFDELMRSVIEGLSPADLAIIGEVIIAEIDRSGDADYVPLPIDCHLDKFTGHVTVTAEQVNGRQIIRIR